MKPTKTNRHRGTIRAVIRLIARKQKIFSLRDVCAEHPSISPQQAQQNLSILAAIGELKVKEPSCRIVVPTMYERTNALRKAELTNKHL